MSEPRRVTVEPGRITVDDPAAGVRYVMTATDAGPVAAAGTVRGRAMSFHATVSGWQFHVADAAGRFWPNADRDGFRQCHYHLDGARLLPEEAVRMIGHCLAEYASVGGHIITEADWLATSLPNPLLAFAHPYLGPRELRLIGVAVARLALTVARSKQTRQALELVEVWVDGPGTEEDLRTAYDRAMLGWSRATPGGADWRARRVAADVALPDPQNWRNSWKDTRHRSEEGAGTTVAAIQQAEADLVRDIAGNPFRPVAFAPAWLTSTVVGLATATYQTRDYTRLPILADALEEAGCDAAEVLDHCRGPGPHARGCWVLDGLMGRRRPG